MSAEIWNELIERELAARQANGNRRARINVTPVDSTHVEIDGNRLVNFASNDYLGLTHHPKVLAAVENTFRKYGFGSGASALITGFTSEHAHAESEIARWKGVEAAVLLSSGYQAAQAIIQTLVQISNANVGRACFYFDKLMHASFIDAIVGSGAAFRTFPHNGLGKLERLLAAATAGQLSVVITESIFSMDGDPCNLPALAKLKQLYPFLLVLDEAHGSGVYGKHGAGYADETGHRSLIDVSLVTLSKAIGGSGAAICSSHIFREALINWGRAYIFSTNLPAASAAAASAAIRVMQEEPQRQIRVRMLAAKLRGELQQAGFEIPPGDSPIIPIILGDEQSALQASQTLRTKGILAVAIRPPTVRRGTSRLRVTISCDHTDEEMNHLIEAVLDLNSRTRGSVR